MASRFPRELFVTNRLLVATRSMRTLLLLALCQLAAPAAAQDATFGERHFVSDVTVDVVVRWTREPAGPHGEVDVVAGGRTQRVHSGAPAHAWGAGGERGLLTALVGASATVEVVFVPIEDGRPGSPRRTSLVRLATGDRAPVGAAVASRPDGFAVFWQEASAGDASALFETYLARFDRDGRATGATTRVNADWPIADVVWLPGSGQYYFLLYYGSNRGTRLCGVHVAGEPLRNLEHPWWASRVGMIDEARLVVFGADRVAAVYRDGEQLYEVEVTGGGWGVEPSRPRRSHGRITPSTAFGARATANGVDIRRVRLDRP